MPATKRTAGSVIRSMFNYCVRMDVLSNDSKAVMKEYFSRTAKLRGGKKKRRTKKPQI
jgi:hypothetical protein